MADHDTDLGKSARSVACGAAPTARADTPFVQPIRLSTSTACPFCQYELIGLRADDLCPECGGAIALSTSTSTLGLSVPCSNCQANLFGRAIDGTCPCCDKPVVESLTLPVAEPRLCIACSYSLLGLPMNGACPECGTPVMLSLRDSMLRNADLGYLTRLNKAARLIRYGAVIPLWTVVATVIATLYSLVHSFGQVSSEVFAAIAILFTVLMMTGLIASYMGWWGLTIPDPGIPSTERAARRRRHARILLACAIAALAVNALTIVGWFTSSLPLNATIAIILPWTAGILLFLWFHAAMRHIRWLSERGGSPSLGTRATWCFRLAAATIVLAVAMTMTIYLIQLATRATLVTYQQWQVQANAAQTAGKPLPPMPPALKNAPGGSLIPLLSCLSIFSLVLWLVLGVSYTVLTGRLRKMIRSAHDFARRSASPNPSASLLMEQGKPPPPASSTE